MGHHVFRHVLSKPLPHFLSLFWVESSESRGRGEAVAHVKQAACHKKPARSLILLIDCGACVFFLSHAALLRVAPTDFQRFLRKTLNRNLPPFCASLILCYFSVAGTRSHWFGCVTLDLNHPSEARLLYVPAFNSLCPPVSPDCSTSVCTSDSQTPHDTTTELASNILCRVTLER